MISSVGRVFEKFALEGATLDTEAAGGFADIAAGVGQHALEVFPLDAFEAGHGGLGEARARAIFVNAATLVVKGVKFARSSAFPFGRNAPAFRSVPPKPKGFGY